MSETSSFFQKKPDETQEDFNFRLGKFSGGLGIVANLLLSSAKIFIGLVSSSVSVVADGVNNLSDIFSSVVTLFSFYISKKPADKEHPFGHGRIEYLCASIVAILVGILGVQLLSNSIAKILHPDTLKISTFLFLVLILSIIVKLFLSLFYGRMAKKTSSSVLAATALDARSDVLSTSLILVSIIVTKFTQVSVDGFLGVLVSLLILKSAFDIIRTTLDHLVGRAPTMAQIVKVRDFILAYEGIDGVHDLILHDYGLGHDFASAHVEVDAHWSLLECHELVDQIESDAVRDLNLQLVLHTDPIIKNDPLQNEAFAKITAILQRKGFECSIHDFRVVHAHDGLNVIFDMEVPQSCTLTDAEILEFVRASIRETSAKYNPVITVDRNYIRSTSHGKLL